MRTKKTPTVVWSRMVRCWCRDLWLKICLGQRSRIDKMVVYVDWTLIQAWLEGWLEGWLGGLDLLKRVFPPLPACAGLHHRIRAQVHAL